MLRKLLSGGNDAVRGLVSVLRLPWTSLLALRPPAKLGVALRSSRLRLRLHAPEERANVNFAAAVRTQFCHRRNDNTANAYAA